MFFQKSLRKICNDTGFHRPIFSCIRTVLQILYFYGKIRVSENAYPCIFLAKVISSSHRIYSIKKVFLRILQYSQEKMGLKCLYIVQLSVGGLLFVFSFQIKIYKHKICDICNVKNCSNYQYLCKLQFIQYCKKVLKEFKVSSLTEADLGLLQHPRWSAL